MTADSQIAAFLQGSHFAVAGASADRSKYGNRVLRAYLQNGMSVTPVNPHAGSIEGVRAVASLRDIGEPVHGLSVVTPPAVTEQVVEEAIRQKIGHIWMQPGAESEAAAATAEVAGLSVIHSGPCLLVVLGFQNDR